MKTKIVAIVALLAVSFSGFSQKKWSLKECVDHALQNNITVKQNKLNVELRKEDVTSAKGNFLPNLSASSGANFGFGSTIDQISNRRISTDNFNNNYSLSSGVNIFNGFRNLNTYKQAKLGVETSKLELERIENDIALRVVNAYLNVLFAKENLNVAKVQYEISKKQIERAKAQVDAGVNPKSDLLNVQSTAASNAQTLVANENTLNLALLTLAQLLQIDANGFDVMGIEVGTPSAALLYDSPKEVYEKALTNRPEIKKAELDIENADLSIDIAKAGFLPSLSASGGVSTGFSHRFNPLGFANQHFFKQVNENLGYSLGFSLNIPLFNRFQTRVGVNKSIINREISEFNLESQKLQLEQTIQKAFLDAKAAAKTYEAAKTSLESQKEAFKNAQESYKYGAMTLFDFDQVRNRLVNAEGAIIRAKYDYVFKTKVLKFYFGESILE